MTKLIAYCGLDCAECAGYQATQADDLEAMERVAAQWRVDYNAPSIDVQAVTCDGCTSDKRLGSHCAECEIRACSRERGYASCAACPDYACEQLQGFFAMAPAAKLTLDGLRAAL